MRSILVRLLGIQVVLDDWFVVAARDARLRLLADKFRGLKPPRFPTVFETVVNAFACQQLSLDVALELLNRLAAITNVNGGTHADSLPPFPSAHDVAELKPEEYRAIGFSRQKALALRGLASAIIDDRLDLERLAQDDDAAARRQLIDLRGVGRWTAEYVLLRGLGRLHVFPGDDVGAQKRLAHWLGRLQPMGYEEVVKAVQRWQPYAGFVYLHLLLEGLSQAGILSLRSAGAVISRAPATSDVV